MERLKQALYMVVDRAVAALLRLVGLLPAAVRDPILRAIVKGALILPFLPDRRVRKRVIALAGGVGRAGSEEGRKDILLAAGIMLPVYDDAEELANRYVADLTRDPNDLRAIKEFSSLRLLPHSSSDARTEFLARIATETRHTDSAHVALAYLYTQRGERDEALEALAVAHEVLESEQPADADAVQRPPGYVVIGPPKAGTTSLHVWLVEHPDVRRSLIKEPRPHYFLPDHSDIYQQFFPKLGRGQVSGDSSASAIYHPWLAEQFLEMNPSIRVLVLHRDPVARAYSHYLMNGRLGNPRPPWTEVVQDTLRSVPTAPVDHDEITSLEHTEPIGSCILPYIKEWLRVIPRNQFRILESRDLFDDPVRAMRHVHQFLGLSDFTASRFRHANEGTYPPGTPRQTHARLAEWFGPHEEALEEFTADHGIRLGRS